MADDESAKNVQLTGSVSEELSQGVRMLSLMRSLQVVFAPKRDRRRDELAHTPSPVED